VIQLSVLLVRSQQEVRVYFTAILVPFKMAASMRKLYTSSIVYEARQGVYIYRGIALHLLCSVHVRVCVYYSKSLWHSWHWHLLCYRLTKVL